MKVNRQGQAALIEIEEKNKIRYALRQPYRTIFDIAWYTGERWGAILQLKQSEVYERANKPRSVLTFPKRIRKRSGGKIAETRQVPVHPRLEESLTGYPLPDSVFMFPSPHNGDKPITFQAVDSALRNALQLTRLANKGISTHSTRRTFITTLYRNGVNIKELMAITGHKSVASFLKYVEVDEARVKNQLLCLD